MRPKIWGAAAEAHSFRDAPKSNYTCSRTYCGIPLDPTFDISTRSLYTALVQKHLVLETRSKV